MKKLLKENKGSTLLTTMFFILVVALLTISLHLALISMINKVADDYDQKQAYVSARGIATAIAEGFQSSSETEYATYTSSTSWDESDVELDDKWLTLLEGIVHVDDYEILENITLTDAAGNQIVLGDNVTGTITKTAESFEDGATMGTATYLLTITTTYGEEVESVSLTINRSISKVTLESVEKEEIEIESDGYLSGFYLDFMPYSSSITYSEDAYDEDDAVFVCQTPVIYTDPDIYFAMKSDFYCASTVVLIGNSSPVSYSAMTHEVITSYSYSAQSLSATKTKSISGEDKQDDLESNIEFFAVGDIYLQDVTVKNADIKSEGNVYIYNTTSTSIKITESSITCNTLYVYGASSDILQFVDCDIYANDIEIVSSGSYVYFDGDTDIYLKNSDNNSKFSASDDDDASSHFSKGEQVETLTIPGRYAAPFASAAEKLSRTMITSSASTVFFEAATIGTTDSIAYTVYELSNEGDTKNYTFTNSQFSGYSDLNPIVIYVPDGVTVTIKGRFGSEGVCFYLKGTAEVIFEALSTDTYDNTYARVYSDALTTDQISSITSSLTAELPNDYESFKGYNDSYLQTIQTNVFGVISSAQDSYCATVTLSQSRELIATVVINCLQSQNPTQKHNKYGLEIEYNYSTDLASQTIDRETWTYGTVDYYTFSVGLYDG